MSTLIALFFVVITISFVCSLFEAVFLSISPAFVGMYKKENPTAGKLLERLKDNVDRPLSAILTLNTVSHTAGSSAIGALAHEMYGNIGITVVSAVLTISILMISEIFPKILGAIYWKNLTPVAIYVIQTMIFILYPIVWLSEYLGKALRTSDQPEITREEIIATAEIGASEGSLHSKESFIIKNLLMLNNMYVSDIMTPRSVIFALDSEMTVEEVFDKYKPIRFSRIPVFEGNLDTIVGMVMRYKIHETQGSDDHDVTIKQIMKPINSVPERMTVASVIDYFVKKKEHMALAVDEYGVVTGLVTLEDAIETLLGVEIVDELDHVPDMRQYALEQWQVRKNQKRIN